MKSKSIISIVVYVIVCIALLGVLAFAVSYINNGQRNFYVQYGNSNIANEKKDIVFAKNATHVFYCRTITEQVIDYDAQILLNVKSIENFDFIVDDNRKNFKNEFTDYDIAKFFNLEKFENYFCISLPTELTLQQVVQSKYSDKVVTGVPDLLLQDSNIFILTVTDGVEKNKSQIYFC